MASPDGVVRVAAVADIHYGKSSHGSLQPLFAQISQKADVLLLGGDLTDYGLPEEARILAEDLTMSAKIPVLAVLGNHDFESDQAEEVSRILTQAGVTMLDGESCEVRGVGFAGVKGFAGGFDQWVVAPWGEQAIKSFVNEAVQEALKLEAALYRLNTPQRVALLHYSPIRATVEGESLEVYPFAGCSRLEEPLDRYSPVAVFHGHAHRGSPSGRTRGGVPVYNVAVPVLKRAFPDQPPFHLVEIELTAEQGGQGAG